MRLLEAFDHIPDLIFDRPELSLDVLDLVVLFFGEGIALLNLLGKLVSDILLFFFGELSEFFVTLDFIFDELILLFDHVNFRINLVNIVVERVVLLVGLDESGHDFLDRANAGLLLDLAEGIFDDVYVTDVHVHEVLLLFIVVSPLL